MYEFERKYELEKYFLLPTQNLKERALRFSFFFYGLEIDTFRQFIMQETCKSCCVLTD